MFWCSLAGAVKAQTEQPTALPDIVKVSSNDAPFRKEPLNESEIIVRVPIGTTAKVLSAEKDYFYVRIGSMNGYMSTHFLTSDSEEFKKYKEYVTKLNQERTSQLNQERRLAQEERIRREQKEAAHERQRINEEHKASMIKKYGNQIGEKVGNGLIWIGMTEDMLIDSWGFPEDVNRTVTANEVRKQYVYPGSNYVYLVNGKVTAWQD